MSMSTRQHMLVNHLKHWCSGEVTGIKVDGRILQQLVRDKVVTRLQDIHFITASALYNTTIGREKMDDDERGVLVARLRKPVYMTLTRLLYGMAMPDMGKEQAMELAKIYRSFERFYAVHARHKYVDEHSFSQVVFDPEHMMELNTWMGTIGQSVIQDIYAMMHVSPIRLVITDNEDAFSDARTDEDDQIAKQTPPPEPQAPIDSGPEPEVVQKFFIKGRFTDLTREKIKQALKQHFDAQFSNRPENADVVLLGDRHEIGEDRLPRQDRAYYGNQAQPILDQLYTRFRTIENA